MSILSERSYKLRAASESTGKSFNWFNFYFLILLPVLIVFKSLMLIGMQPGPAFTIEIFMVLVYAVNFWLLFVFDDIAFVSTIVSTCAFALRAVVIAIVFKIGILNAGEGATGIAADIFSIFKDAGGLTLSIYATVCVVLAELNLIYFIKRKDLFYKKFTIRVDSEMSLTNY